MENNKIQFKRGTKTQTQVSLDSGELYVNYGAQTIILGGNKNSSSTTNNFTIKSKPVVNQDIVTPTGTVITKFITDLKIANNPETNTTEFKIYTNGNTTTPAETQTIEVKGKVSNAVLADTATTATKLSTSKGSNTQPIWFSSGKPALLSLSEFNNEPITMSKTGVISKATKFTGEISASQISLSGSGAKVGQLINVASVSGTSCTIGRITSSIGSATNPIYIDSNGVPKVCNYSIKSFIYNSNSGYLSESGTPASNLGISTSEPGTYALFGEEGTFILTVPNYTALANNNVGSTSTMVWKQINTFMWINFVKINNVWCLRPQQWTWGSSSATLAYTYTTIWQVYKIG